MRQKTDLPFTNVIGEERDPELTRRFLGSERLGVNSLPENRGPSGKDPTSAVTGTYHWWSIPLPYEKGSTIPNLDTGGFRGQCNSRGHNLHPDHPPLT